MGLKERSGKRRHSKIQASVKLSSLNLRGVHEEDSLNKRLEAGKKRMAMVIEEKKFMIPYAVRQVEETL